MGIVTKDHFGANIVLTNDGAYEGAPFREMLKDISFSQFRYPGGGVTESHTWENGGLDKIFGPAMKQGEDGYVMTIREALELCQEHDSSLAIVIPTTQFFDPKARSFDDAGFKKYLSSLKAAFEEFPDVKISAFEIGNEYWNEKIHLINETYHITEEDYGFIANAQIPALNDFNDELSTFWRSDWTPASIGIQAGRDWHSDGAARSQKIANQISLENRELVDDIYQHIYIDPLKDQSDAADKHMASLEAFHDIEGFSNNLSFRISEFNIDHRIKGEDIYNVNQGTYWIEEFSRYIDEGIDGYDHWGINYKWLTTKFYDARPAWLEHDKNEIVTKATPMGQVFDLAQNQLPGKHTISDSLATNDMLLSQDFSITGFADSEQKVIFIGNVSDDDGKITLGKSYHDYLVTVHHITPAEIPGTDWHNESAVRVIKPQAVLDARGDMKVTSWNPENPEIVIGSNEMIILSINHYNTAIYLEGAHNSTDSRTRAVDDNFSGANGNDYLQGHVGDDHIDGGAGDDILTGGRGNDTLLGSNGNDTLIATGGFDYLDGGLGDDLLVVDQNNEEHETLIETGAGRDIVLLNSFGNVILSDFDFKNDFINILDLFKNFEEFERSLKITGDNINLTTNNGSTIIFNNNSEFTSDVQSIFWKSNPNYANFHNTQLKLEELETVRENFYHLQNYQSEGGISDIKEKNIFGDDPIRSHDERYRQQEQDNAHAEEDVTSPGDCFVATAVFGDPSHPDVIALRNFRDYHLKRSWAGRKFIRFYWVIGPPLAKMVSPQSLRGKICRKILTVSVSILQTNKL